MSHAVTRTLVGRIWADAGLKPHIVTGFKVSNDPMFGKRDADPLLPLLF